MGDDIPDFEVMKQVGMSCAPADAATEIKQIAKIYCPGAGRAGVRP